IPTKLPPAPLSISIDWGCANWFNMFCTRLTLILLEISLIILFLTLVLSAVLELTDVKFLRASPNASEDEFAELVKLAATDAWIFLKVALSILQVPVKETT